MADDKFINKITKGSETYTIHAELAENANAATVAETAEYAEKANKIGNNVSTYSVVDTKPREGLKFTNNGVEAIIDLNYNANKSTGNLEIESRNGHVNIESSKGVQIKPTTTIIFDSSRRILANKGNEIQVEAKFDDYSNYQKGEAPEYNGKDGVEEEYAELKLNSRNVDLRCHKHGGIALQIAGCDNYNNPSAEHHENKIKFESDRKVPLSDNFNPTPSGYQGEGGKGLEFGTFNNEHTSLYTQDYRFRGQGTVFGVLREAPVMIDGKFDYPTQEDDFKDVITNATPNATWNEIIDAANKCKGKEAIASENYVNAQIAQAQLPEGEVDLSAYATTEYVDNAIASAGGGAALEAGNGITISEGRVSVNNYSNIEPLTALTDNVVALSDIKIGKSKGNFTVDVTGEYTWEQTGPKSATTIDERGNVLKTGERVVLHENESFYEDTNKVYYKAGVDTTLADESTPAPKGTIVYRTGYTISFDDVPSEGEDSYAYYLMGDNEESYYENPANSYYKCKAKSGATYFNGEEAHKDDTVSFAGLTQEEIEYYDSLGAQYDEDGNEIVKAVWEKVDIWKKCPIWTVNEININLETDSKIKFAGNKIETVWTVDDVDKKMSEISLSTESLVGDITTVEFEKKISKNGDRSGQDTEIVYSYTNNVSDQTKVANFAAFKSNYNKKHTPKTDEELQLMYDEFLAEGTSYEVRVTISELLGLVARVSTLESTVAELESRIEALENNNPE